MFTLSFDTGNAAFDDDDKPYEVCRILAEVSRSVAEGRTGGIIRDINGNKIGSWKMED